MIIGLAILGAVVGFFVSFAVGSEIVSALPWEVVAEYKRLIDALSVVWMVVWTVGGAVLFAGMI